MKLPSHTDMTVGERRGLIVLTILILLTVGLYAGYEHTYHGDNIGISERYKSSSEAICDSLTSILRGDTSSAISSKEPNSSNNKKGIRRTRPKVQPKSAAKRSPRDERVD